MEKYLPKEIENKWQQKWKNDPSIYAADDLSTNEKKYILDMFPYPSGDGLHIGHVESYTATDIISRYFRMKGFNVLHPQGWDAFGLPAENFAIKTGVHPSETTKKAIANFTKQINSLGFSYDWSREINTSDPGYYKWTQWIFLQLYKNGFAYKKKAKVNWCPSCKTVLANEQVIDGKCERCNSEVIQKDLEQWFFRITDFIENKGETIGLLNGLEKVDWPDSTKAAQRNWIGKSEGTQFGFRIKDSEEAIEVYTTRVDTAFGITYVVVAPEHPVISNLKSKISNFAEVEKYLIEAQNKTELERTELQKEKTGVRLEGVEVINPFTGEAVPLFVADYVLGGYGTGAVMAVPAHDERDYAFAKKYNLAIKEVVSGGDISKQAFTDDGVLINSSDYTGLDSAEARQKMADWLEKENVGKKKVNYRLRDWLVSRQRYWGAPIPIIYCEDCGAVPVPENDLPVVLPTDVDFKPTGESPLVNSKTFHEVNCPSCGKKAKREVDTMDTFVCSSWYYFRYADPKNADEFAASEKINKWLPVDLYVGGAEHTVLHLLYARFFTKALHHLGYLDFDEPFSKLRHQGIILAEDGNKMSKSKGNVVNPDTVVAEVGADVLRMYEMFMGPLEDMKPWSTQGIVGIVRFLEKIWKLQEKISDGQLPENGKNKALIHKTIKKVTDNIESFRYNTAISSLMILVNAFEKEKEIAAGDFEALVAMISPFAPHIAEELWEKLGHQTSVTKAEWPKADAELMKEEEVEMVVQVNGKVRERLMIAPDVTEDEAKETALESEKVKAFTQGKEIKKIIFVPGKLINIVVD
ncbi:MAG TPA: leucine--tRNA ligase [Patescibacteria group bacterium]